MPSIKDEIKLLLIKNGLTMTKLNEMINEKYGRNDTVQNLNNKLSKGTIRYSEILEIAEVLCYKIVWAKKSTLFEVTLDEILDK